MISATGLELRAGARILLSETNLRVQPGDRICANLGLPDRVLTQPLGTLSGGQRRRIELARILFADAAETGGGTLLLDEPTNHLDADSITWLRGFLAGHKGGLIVISHDVGLLDAVVNKVWYLDAHRSVVDG